eukprot:SAG31_NODE_1390_length_8539_cov_12.684834_9_plen_458_part_00
MTYSVDVDTNGNAKSHFCSNQRAIFGILLCVATCILFGGYSQLPLQKHQAAVTPSGDPAHPVRKETARIQQRSNSLGAQQHIAQLPTSTKVHKVDPELQSLDAKGADILVQNSAIDSGIIRGSTNKLPLAAIAPRDGKSTNLRPKETHGGVTTLHSSPDSAIENGTAADVEEDSIFTDDDQSLDSTSNSGDRFSEGGGAISQTEGISQTADTKNLAAARQQDFIVPASANTVQNMDRGTKKRAMRARAVLNLMYPGLENDRATKDQQQRRGAVVASAAELEATAEESLARAQVAQRRVEDMRRKRAEAEMRLAMFAENAKGELQCKTTGGTAPQGSLCSFPFVYKGVNYTACTAVDNGGHLWCRTKSKISSQLDGLWGNCTCSVGFDSETASYMFQSLATVLASYKLQDQTNADGPRAVVESGVKKTGENHCTGVRYLRGDCDELDVAVTSKNKINK